MTAAKAKAAQADDNEMEMVSVNLDDTNLQFVPGPDRDKMRVLRDWCLANATGKYSVNEKSLTFTFTEAVDGKKFDAAWTRTK